MAEPFHSLKGQLLLDGGKLKGSCFHRSVVLVCQHDREGAFGLVLTQGTGSKVGDMLDAPIPAKLKAEPLYLGGPVQTNALSYLHTDVFVPHANVMSKLNLGHSLDELRDLADSYSTTQQFRLFAGYAGWSAGQLEQEMAREAWLTFPASIPLVFHAEPEKLWKEVLAQMGWKYRLLADAPEDFSAN